MCMLYVFEQQHNKTNKVACGPMEDSDQPGCLSSLIRVLDVGMELA